MILHENTLLWKNNLKDAQGVMFHSVDKYTITALINTNCLEAHMLRNFYITMVNLKSRWH